VSALLRAIDELGIDVVAISGDLTQRARPHEFQKARAFLSRLGVPYVVVPGNHDIAPLSSPIERLLTPLKRYEDGLGEAEVATYFDTELSIVGLDSVSRYRVKQGELRPRRLAAGLSQLSAHQSPLRVVVSHHPMGIVRRLPGQGRAAGGIETKLSHAEVALHLCGHAHTSTSRTLSGTHPDANFVEVAAGTATSHRVRGEANAFNVLELSATSVDLTVHQFGAERFRPGARTRYERIGKCWSRRVPADDQTSGDATGARPSLATPRAYST
jgi:3',5'-cyclic AMP phosphodiesterase CpdA